MNLTPKLTVNAGLRFDHYSSWLPEQGNPGTGPYATPRVIPETHGFPVYNAWSPRLSAVYDITGSGRIALKASYGRYAASGSGVNNAAGPVAASVNPAATLVSTYTRWDGRIPYTPIAADLTSVTGSSRDTTLDDVAQGRVSRRVHRRRRPWLLARHLDSDQRRPQARLSRQQGAESRAAVRGVHRHGQRHRSRPRQRRGHGGRQSRCRCIRCRARIRLRADQGADRQRR